MSYLPLAPDGAHLAISLPVPVLPACAPVQATGELSMHGNCCERKVTHRSLASAQYAVQKMRKRSPTVRLYRCQSCGWWHVGKHNE